MNQQTHVSIWIDYILWCWRRKILNWNLPSIKKNSVEKKIDICWLWIGFDPKLMILFTFIYLNNCPRSTHCMLSGRKWAIMRYSSNSIMMLITTTMGHRSAALTQKTCIHWTRKANSHRMICDERFTVSTTRTHTTEAHDDVCFGFLFLFPFEHTNLSMRTIAKTKIIQHLTNDNNKTRYGFTRAPYVSFLVVVKIGHTATDSVLVHVTACVQFFELKYLCRVVINP